MDLLLHVLIRALGKLFLRLHLAAGLERALDALAHVLIADEAEPVQQAVVHQLRLGLRDILLH